MATELTQRPAPPAETPKVLPQRPASRSGWVEPEGAAPVEPPKPADQHPDALLLIKTPGGYAKALEIEKGKDLFPEGSAAREFTEILAKSLSEKMAANCTESGSREIRAALEDIRIQLDARRKMDEFAALLLAIALAAGLLTTIAFFVIGKIRGR